MNCATHAEAPAVAFCRTCGKAVCNDCRQERGGVVYCGTCVATEQTAMPPAASNRVPPPGQGPAPGLAFVLGLIPGVGAIYNGQYAKGIVHVVVLGLLISIVDSDAARGMQPLFVMLIFAWFFYMALEAYHTAKKRLAGEQVDEFSGVLQVNRGGNAPPVGPIALIVLGVVFLLNTLDLLKLERMLRFWPVILIVAGIYLLYTRAVGERAPAGPSELGPSSAPPSNPAPDREAN